jgi:signal transduction histidine kinase
MEWAYRYTPYAWPVFATAAFCWVLCLFGWRHRSRPGEFFFRLTFLIAGLWVCGVGMQLLSANEFTQHFWFKLSNLCLAFPCTTALCFVLAYAGLEAWLTPRNLELLAIPPVGIGLLILTNDLHNRMWSAPVMGDYLQVHRQLGGWIAIGYNYLVYGCMLAVLLWLFIRSPLHRWPAVLILLGSLAPRLALLLSAAGWRLALPIPPEILATNITCLCYVLVFTRFHFFDVIPLARATVVDRLDDGMIVIDAIGRIADANRSALDILNMPRAELIGQNAVQVLARLPALGQLLEHPSTSQAPLQFTAQSRWYAAGLHPLLDGKGLCLGQVLQLNDTTDIHQAQAEQLEREHLIAAIEERRRMARDLHDEISQALGFINLQAQAAAKLLAAGENRIAGALLDRLSEASCSAQEDLRELIANLMAGKYPGQTQPEIPDLNLDSFGCSPETQPDARPENVGDGLLPLLDPMAEEKLLQILREALVNIRKHACAENVQVTLVLNQTGIEARVEDDGVGFEPGGPSGCGETFGLRIMAERAEELGGSLQVNSQPGDGTQVVLHIPSDSP